MKTSEIITLFQKKKYKEVLNYIEENKTKSILETEEEARIFYYEGLCYANLKKYDESLIVLDYCVSLTASIEYMYQCRMLRGYIYTVTKRPNLAEAEFLQLLEEGYESPKVFAALAHVVYQRNKVSQAVKYLQRALEIDPENINALNSMAYILSEHDVKLPLALKYAEKVLKKHPRNPAYLDTYGMVLIKLRRFTDAKRVLGLALKITKHPDIKEHYKLAIKDSR